MSQRRNFARELHDGINQLMVSVKFRIELARDKLEQPEQRALAELEKGSDVLNQAIQEVRRISHDLRPILLDDLGLESALHSMTDDFAERTGITVDVSLDLPVQRLTDDIEITLYRVTQEALTNVERHANARQVWLTVWQKDSMIWVEVKDDGKGFSCSAQGSDDCGIGLMNMRERTEILSGDFSVRSKPGMGTRVRAGLALV